MAKMNSFSNQKVLKINYILQQKAEKKVLVEII